MKSLANLLLAILLPVCALIGSNLNVDPAIESTNTIEFHNGSFESGMNKASTEGKLFFVEFYADWCTPCKWMDKTTYTNQKVVKLLNTNFVALKLDIETEEGASMKKQFSVRMLPTILIFNSEGDMVERVEKTLSPQSMVSLLSFHDSTKSDLTVTYPYNTSPKKVEEAQDKELDDLYNRYLTRKRTRTNYKLQIANYTDYQLAFNKVNELSETFMEPIIVVNDYVDNMTQYKVMMGEFQTMDEAEGFRVILKRDFEIDSIIH